MTHSPIASNSSNSKIINRLRAIQRELPGTARTDRLVALLTEGATLLLSGELSVGDFKTLAPNYLMFVEHRKVKALLNNAFLDATQQQFKELRPYFMLERLLSRVEHKFYLELPER